jgi:chromosome segregation protein
MKKTSDELTRAEVEAAHLGDRRAEAEREIASIAERLGEEIPPASEALTDEARGEIDKRLERLERRRAQIGPVNPLAEQEYDEAREHVEALQAQREDIERSMRELESLIRDIDAEIERAFEETFEATAKNFEEMVEHLFPGGRGRLRRVSLQPVRDEERPAGEQEAPTDAEPEPEPEEEEEQRDELGVEIEVTPAGKSTRKLSLLSGGEKSLVALAFVFAVFLARPCPFYILDEVEAALDDANIDRFLQLIRRFSDRAQFVIVTHQKRTMDAADVLYGVSMGGDGVTKVVSRRLPREIAEDAEDEDEAPGLSAVA